MNNWTSFHLEHFQAHCKNSVSLSIEIRLALKGPWYRVSLSVPFHSARVKDTGAGLLCEVCQLKEHIDDDDLQGTKCLASAAAGNSQPDDVKSIGSD
jgi:hypothetical protein